MPRQRGMLGPDSAKMGGGGRKPGVPHTPMAGAGVATPRPPAGPPGGGLMGGPPPRPPAAPVARPPGLAGPTPGGAPVGPPPSGLGGGFKKGGAVSRLHEKNPKKPGGLHNIESGGARPGARFAGGGPIPGGQRDMQSGGQRPGERQPERLAKGGIVGGGDAKKRVGRDTGHGTKSC